VLPLDGPPEPPGALRPAQSELECLRAALAARSAECDALRARLGGDSPQGGGSSSIGGSSESPRGGSGGAPQSALDRLLRRASEAREARLRRTSAAGTRGGGGGGDAAEWPGRRVSGPQRRTDGGLGDGASEGGSSAGSFADRGHGSGGGSGGSASGRPAVGSLIWRILQLHRSAEGAAAPGPRHGRPASVPPQAEATAAGAAATPLRRHCSLAAGELPDARCAGGDLDAAPRCSGGGGGGAAAAARRASDGGGAAADAWRRSAAGAGAGPAGLGGVSGGGAADDQAQDAGARDAALREHIQRSLIQLLQAKKAEARALQQRVAELEAALAAAAAEKATREAKLQQMRDGVARLGEARSSEVARWAAHLQGLESSLRQAQQEVDSYHQQAATARAALDSQAGQLRLLGAALAGAAAALGDAQRASQGAAGVASCLAALAGAEAQVAMIAEAQAVAQEAWDAQAAGAAGSALAPPLPRELLAPLHQLLLRAAGLVEERGIGEAPGQGRRPPPGVLVAPKAPDAAASKPMLALMQKVGRARCGGGGGVKVASGRGLSALQARGMRSPQPPPPCRAPQLKDEVAALQGAVSARDAQIQRGAAALHEARARAAAAEDALRRQRAACGGGAAGGAGAPAERSPRPAAALPSQAVGCAR
jgi:hypothetical protein